MFKRRAFATTIFVLVLASAGVTGALAYVQTTIAKYDRAPPCGKLHGIPRILQAAYFIPSSGCIVDVAKGGCHDSRVCTISNPPSGTSTTGHCTPTSDKKNCVCVADKSKGANDK
jgi:hypothetical protein